MSMTSKLSPPADRARPWPSHIRLEGALAIRTAGIFGLEVINDGDAPDEGGHTISPEDVEEATYEPGRLFVDAPSDLELRVRAEDYALSDYQTELSAAAWLEHYGLAEGALVVVYPTGLVVSVDTNEVLREGMGRADEGIWSWAMEQNMGEILDEEARPVGHPKH